MLLPVYFLISYILYTTGGALPAVLAGAVVAFLLLTLLIAEIIVGAVLLKERHTRRDWCHRARHRSRRVVLLSQAKQQRNRRVQRSTLPMLVMTSPLMGEWGCTRGWM